MRRRYVIGVTFASAAVLAACGTVSTQSTNKPSQTSSPLKASKPTSTPTSEYLNIYKGMPNEPVSSNGYPFVVPDELRILAPKLLKKEVLDTKLAKIGDVYVGTNWTPSQRMEIYTAKMFWTYGDVFSNPQYLETTGPYAQTNRAILSEIPTLFAPFYGSVAAVDKQMVTTLSDGLAIFRGDLPGQFDTGINTTIKPTFNTTDISFSNGRVNFALPKGSVAVKLTGPGASIYTGGLTYITGVKEDPGEWSHVWEVVGSGAQVQP
jgi:hypothetical protein